MRTSVLGRVLRMLVASFDAHRHSEAGKGPSLRSGWRRLLGAALGYDGRLKTAATNSTATAKRERAARGRKASLS